MRKVSVALLTAAMMVGASLTSYATTPAQTTVATEQGKYDETVKWFQGLDNKDKDLSMMVTLVAGYMDGSSYGVWLHTNTMPESEYYNISAAMANNDPQFFYLPGGVQKTVNIGGVNHDVWATTLEGGALKKIDGTEYYSGKILSYDGVTIPIGKVSDFDDSASPYHLLPGTYHTNLIIDEDLNKVVGFVVTQIQ